MEWSRIKKLLILSFLFIFTLLYIKNSNAQVQKPPLNLPIEIDVPEEIYSPVKPKKVSFQFKDITISTLMNLIFSEATRKSYVLSPDVINDTRLISFRFNQRTDGDLFKFLGNFLESLGYDLQLTGNVYFVSTKKSDQKPYEIWGHYVPKYRSANYLQDNLRFIFPKSFETQTTYATPDASKVQNPAQGSAAQFLQRNMDFLIFKAESQKHKKEILEVVKLFDVKQNDILVKAYIYEVSFNDTDGSALNLLLNLANSKLKINLGSSDPLLNFAKLTTSSFEILFSTLQTDNRFNLMSSPFLRVSNGKNASISVGQQVPTLGAVSYQGQSGTPVQAIEYKDTGLIFQIKPEIFQSQINVQLSQNYSEVQQTTTGVNNTPTITKRETKTDFSVNKNEYIVLSGLTSNKNSKSKSAPALLPFFTSNTEQKSNTEIILILKIEEANSLENSPS